MVQNLPYKFSNYMNSLDQSLATTDVSETGHIVEVDLSFAVERRDKCMEHPPCPEN